MYTYVISPIELSLTC